MSRNLAALAMETRPTCRWTWFDTTGTYGPAAFRTHGWMLDCKCRMGAPDQPLTEELAWLRDYRDEDVPPNGIWRFCPRCGTEIVTEEGAPEIAPRVVSAEAESDERPRVRQMGMSDGTPAQWFVEGSPKAIPSGYAIPNLLEMRFGGAACADEDDLEYVQTIRGTGVVTSVTRRDDAADVIPPDERLGRQWVASVDRMKTADDRGDDGRNLVRVVLDCGTQVDAGLAQATCMSLLREVISTAQRRRS